MSFLRLALSGLWSLRRSILAFALSIAGAFLSLGYVSLVLYGVSAPIITLFFPPLGSWRGPWVWPVLVGVAILWSVSFLIAGIVDLWLQRRDWSSRRRGLAYLGVLWIGAIASWLIVLGLSWPGDA